MNQMIDPFLRGFGYSPVDLPLAEVEWLTNRRTEAKNAYARLGLPTVRNEVWKYTNLKSLRNIDFRLASDPFSLALSALPKRVPNIDSYRIVFVNGVFDATLSDLSDLPNGVRLGSLATAIKANPSAFEGRLGKLVSMEDDALIALNSAYLADGLYFEVDRGIVLEKPVHLVNLTYAGEDALSFHPRHLMEIGDGAVATILETRLGITNETPTFGNSVAEIELGRDANLGHYLLQKESDHGNIVAVNVVTTEKGATYDNFALHLGGKIIRNEIRCQINGEHGQVRLNGAYLADGERLIDTTTFIDHVAENTASREVYKGVLDDKGRGVFQAKTLVRKSAQKTDGHQLHKAMLLSDKAEVDSKPELEIYADDVKCAHGSTSGALDDNQLFYLKSRGIDEKRARAMLVQAFLHDAVDEIQNKAIAELFHDELAHRLGEGS